jgi:hypothetical protein
MAEEIQAHEILQRLFNVIVAEARNSPTLSKKLLRAFPKDMVPSIKMAPPISTPPQFHAVNELRAYGENVLRGKLEQIRSKENLRAIAKASSLVLGGAATKRSASLADIVDGIVEAAKHYDRQRTGASQDD